ncbi:MAG: PilZ domain-containing protein [Nitrospirota bacterium]
MEPPSRKNKRRSVINPVQYTRESETAGDVFDGVVFNISESGFFMITPEALQEGQKITIREGLHPCPREAIVKWSRKYKDIYYKVGAEFI